LKSKGKKICIVASSLGRGGAEQSAAVLSVMLHNLGHDIYIVSVLDHIDYHYEGTLCNLGISKKQDDSLLGRLHRLKIFKKFLTSNAIELVIDNRSRVQAYREFIITKFIYRVPSIYVIRSFNAHTTFTPYRWLNKWLYRNECMIAVSKASQLKFQNLFGLNKIGTIYNGFDFDDIKKKSDKAVETFIQPYIIFYGRLDDTSKNISLLLEAYKLSRLPGEHINLLILGNGPDAEKLKLYSNTLNLNEHVIFKDFLSNPYPYVKHSQFMVLSSRYEGFPRVIPEALSLGVPVVSVDCESGPNEVIIEAENGLLVENHNPEKLSEAMNRMAFEKHLLASCKSNAAKSVQRLSIDEISKAWNNLIKELGHDKN
jgi:glycosyltransferase involved in cell wall biosynthesis